MTDIIPATGNSDGTAIGTPAKRPPSKANKIINKAVVAMNIFVYRKSGGKLLGRMGKLDFLLLTTRGRKTGRNRTSPVAYLYDAGRFVICAAYGGGAVNPAWFHNLCAFSKVTVEIGREQISAVASVVPPGTERDGYWQRLVAALPVYATYQKRTSRLLPIVVITPDDLAGTSKGAF